MAARQPLPKITIDEDVLTCVVCLEIFTNPKVLPCHHSFCEECLKTIAGTKSMLECPTCRNTCSLPEGGVMDLKPSFLINNILDSLVQQRDNTISDLCDTCQGGKPENRCVECNLRICGVCTSAHRKIPATTDHHVIPDKLSMDSMDESVQGGFCKTHKSQKLEFYCERCQIAICCECVLTKHKPPQHRRKSLKDAAASCKEKLQEYIMQMKIKQSEIQSSRVMAERIANLAERRYERELGKIKMQVQNVIENLFVEEKKLLTDLKIIYDGIKEIGHRQAGAFRSMEHLITSTLTAIELLELQDNPINVITALEETKDSMNYLKSVDTKLK
ncbi:E3 ubiquitin-protein ligase TRIM56-like [Ptychodera flava]|uniref:E3 ubiquitin-protein ligase TRIM56-like n=1 Tax=Ptychodera flava TaxID=63121 RepID=UPI00396A87ED